MLGDLQLITPLITTDETPSTLTLNCRVSPSYRSLIAWLGASGVLGSWVAWDFYASGFKAVCSWCTAWGLGNRNGNRNSGLGLRESRTLRVLGSSCPKP